MYIEFCYQFYRKANVSHDNYFQSIRNLISPEYHAMIERSISILVPAEFDDIMNADQTGLMIHYPEDGSPSVVLEELLVKFPKVDESSDYRSDLSHLLEKFGEKVTSYKVFDEKHVNPVE